MESPDTRPDPESATAVAPTVEQAYSSAGGPRLLPWEEGKEKPTILQPWSGRRRTAAFELGLKGDGSPLDPIRLLFTCVMAKSDVALVFRRADQVIEKMLAWAEQHECLDPTMKNYGAAAEMAMAIMQESDLSAFNSEGDGTPTGN